MREVEWYQIDIVGLTYSTVMEPDAWRGARLSFSGVAHGERCQAGVRILTSAAVLEFSPVNERVTSITYNFIKTYDFYVEILKYCAKIPKFS